MLLHPLEYLFLGQVITLATIVIQCKYVIQMQLWLIVLTYLAVSEVCRHEDRWQGGLVHFRVVVGIDADLLPPELEGEHAVLHLLQLMVRLDVWVAPKAAVHQVGKTLLLGNLEKERKINVNEALSPCRGPDNYATLIFLLYFRCNLQIYCWHATSFFLKKMYCVIWRPK